jgi:hypothetical protein
LEQADFLLFRPNFSLNDGRDYVYDPSITHPNRGDAKSFRTNPTKGFNIARKTKNDKYKVQCEKIGRNFIPLPAYTYGNISPELQQLASNLACKISEHLSWPHSVAVNHVFCSISTTIARANSFLLLSRFSGLEVASRQAELGNRAHLIQNSDFPVSTFASFPFASLGTPTTRLSTPSTSVNRSFIATPAIADCVTDDELCLPPLV